jgi:hypothetical protein
MGRVHGLDTAQNGLLFGLVYGVLGVGGPLSGGGYSDLMSKKQENCKLRFPALAAAIVFPAYLIFLLADTL